MKITLFKPHKSQLNIIKLLENPIYNYIVVSAGRRFGKSDLAINAMVKYALEYPNSTIIYLNPKGDQRSTIWNEFSNKFESAPFIDKLNRSTSDAFFTNKSKILFRLASFPAVEAIRGKKADFIICDEMAMYRAEVWETILQPVLATISRPKALFLSTPRGRGQFYKMFNMCHSHSNWASYHAPSSDNPLVSKQFLEDVKIQIPEKIFKQEYLAEFIDDAGALFENITANAASPSIFQRTTKLWAGIDVGFTNDFTVLTIINEHSECIYQDRFNQCTMQDAADRLAKILKEFKYPFTYIENNNYQGLTEMLRDRKVANIEPFFTDQHNKKAMIENLINLFQQNQIKIPDNQETIAEFESFEYTYNPKTRNISYSAPEGLHDDIVMSNALAHWSKKNKRGFSW